MGGRIEASLVKCGYESGLLTVISYDKEKQKWKCLCRCKRFTFVRTENLKNKKIKSCGCNWIASHNKPKLLGFKAVENIVYRRYESDAKKRRLPFHLSNKLFCELMYKPCHYCGLEPASKESRKKYTKYYSDFRYNGIDRKNNELGYTKDNCVTCCKTCNLAKRKMTLEEFTAWVDKIYNHLFMKDKNYVGI